MERLDEVLTRVLANCRVRMLRNEKKRREGEHHAALPNAPCKRALASAYADAASSIEEKHPR